MAAGSIGIHDYILVQRLETRADSRNHNVWDRHVYVVFGPLRLEPQKLQLRVPSTHNGV